MEDHEEFGDGLGFPNKKNYFRMLTDSKVFNLCDFFDHFCLSQKKTALEAIEPFIEAHSEHFDPDLLGLLEGKLKS